LKHGLRSSWQNASDISWKHKHTQRKWNKT